MGIRYRVSGIDRPLRMVFQRRTPACQGGLKAQRSRWSDLDIRAGQAGNFSSGRSALIFLQLVCLAHAQRAITTNRTPTVLLTTSVHSSQPLIYSTRDRSRESPGTLHTWLVIPCFAGTPHHGHLYRASMTVRDGRPLCLSISLS